ncbi:hypothetical protein [uncultured Lamprocystis sp.]|jgi:hypothetical protein|uniref:hypothetical protein n=1 Tax=uncultured Lamprocystis sp. TaxID=543132 RepID=UPI0025F7A5DE|nr:hypothetical protein [uncultured Lamprocystis sp.]
MRQAALGLWFATVAVVMPAAGAPDPVLARVLSIAPDRVTLTLDEPQGDATGPVVVPLGEAGLPPGITVGQRVRLWPGAAPGTLDPWTNARLVPLEREGIERDRTGVRARLMHGAQRGLGGGRGGR